MLCVDTELRNADRDTTSKTTQGKARYDKDDKRKKSQAEHDMTDKSRMKNL